MFCRVTSWSSRRLCPSPFCKKWVTIMWSEMCWYSSRSFGITELLEIFSECLWPAHRNSFLNVSVHIALQGLHWKQMWFQCSEVNTKHCISVTEWLPGGVAQWAGRASDSRSKDPRFEHRLRQEHKTKNGDSCFESKLLCWLALGVANPPCVYSRLNMIPYARSRSCSPCQSSVDYDNTKRPSMHFIIN